MHSAVQHVLKGQPLIIFLSFKISSWVQSFRKQIDPTHTTTMTRTQNEKTAQKKKTGCPHGKRKTRCNECGGKSICEHGSQKFRCKECGEKSICEHRRHKVSALYSLIPSCSHTHTLSLTHSHSHIISPHKYTCKDCGEKAFASTGGRK